MLSKKTQNEILNNYRNGEITRLNYYDYSIRYIFNIKSHICEAVIVRKQKRKSGNDSWELYHPLSKSIK